VSGARGERRSGRNGPRCAEGLSDSTTLGGDRLTISCGAFVFDQVDGTLFTDSHDLHPRTLSAIRYIRETYPDLPFIPVTGKQRVSCA